MERQRGGRVSKEENVWRVRGPRWSVATDARSPALHCKYSRGSPGFLEPDPIGSASTANLDLSPHHWTFNPADALHWSSIEKLPFLFFFTSSPLLSSSAIFQPFVLLLFFFSSSSSFPFFFSFDHFCRAKSPLSALYRGVVVSLCDTLASGAAASCLFTNTLTPCPVDKLLLNGNTAAAFAPREINRSPIPDVASATRSWGR